MKPEALLLALQIEWSDLSKLKSPMIDDVIRQVTKSSREMADRLAREFREHGPRPLLDYEEFAMAVAAGAALRVRMDPCKDRVYTLELKLPCAVHFIGGSFTVGVSPGGKETT